MDKSNDNNTEMGTTHEFAKKFSEAHTYIMDNSYLNPSQKMEVELWYQFPSTISYTALCACLIYHSFYFLQIKLIIGLPLIVDILIGVFNWYAYKPRLNKAFFLSIGHNYFQWIISLSTISILIYHQLYWWAAIAFVGKLGLLALFSPSISLYSRFARKYRMHPKYAFFKKYHNEHFPFEYNLEEEPEVD
jgi:hypothetical protein